MKRMKLNIQLFAGGTIEFAFSGNLQGKIEWSSNGNIDTNTSSVSCHLYARRNYGYTYGPDWTGSITIDGTTSYFNGFNYSVRIETEWVLIFSAYKNVQHNQDGSKTITISGSVTGPSGTSLAGVTSSGSGNAVLDNLHKAPDVTMSITEHWQPIIDAGVPDNIFVANLSEKYVELNITTYDGATVSNRVVYNGNQAYTYAIDIQHPNTIDMDVYNYPLYVVNNQVPVSAVVTDNKGGSRTITGYYDYIPYIKPSLGTNTTVKRYGQTSGLVRLNIQASFYNDFIYDVQNSVTIKYKYWEDGTQEPSDSNYITIPSSSYSISGNNVSVSNYEIGSTTTTDPNYFNFEKKYNVKINIQDAMNSSQTISYSITKGLAVWTEYHDRVDFMNISMGGMDIFPVGYIFLTTDTNFNPNGKYKGTWTKLTADAYLKIVTSNAGSLGGTSSEHKIPLSSIPPHTHDYGAGAPYRTSDGSAHYSADTTYNPVAATTSAGGGQPYYPYYYGVIAWHRDA